ncbi:unnamed protein product [Ixodes persulcatus]
MNRPIRNHVFIFDGSDESHDCRPRLSVRGGIHPLSLSLFFLINCVPDLRVPLTELSRGSRLVNCDGNRCNVDSDGTGPLHAKEGPSSPRTRTKGFSSVRKCHSVSSSQQIWLNEAFTL